MKSRLSNYLESAKLAKMELVVAQEKAAAKDLWQSQVHMARAVSYLITANNNLASIAFGQKPKRTVQRTAVAV